MNNNDKILNEFWRRLKEDWLPSYCNDAKRCYSVNGFKGDAKDVTAVDARDFLRALDYGVVSDIGAGGMLCLVVALKKSFFGKVKKVSRHAL